MFKKTLLFSMAIIAMWACSSKQNKTDQAEPASMNSEDTIEISAQSPALSRIKTEVVALQDYNTPYTTTGAVKTITGSLAEVSSPFEGRIVKSCVRLGQKVSAGSPVFAISSPDYIDAVKAMMQARQEKQTTGNSYKRQKDLLANGVGSQKDFEEAESAYRIATKEFEKASASLKVFNVKPENSSLNSPLVIKSPISGEVVKDNLVTGQYIKSDAEPAVTIANLSKVWVIARVKEKNIGKISPKDNVRIKTDAFPDTPVQGFVSYIGNLLDEQTRSVEVYIECENQKRMLKPGMFTSVTFYHKEKNVLLVPVKAILQEENSSYLFVQLSHGHYVKRKVEVASSDEKVALISQGVKPGEEIVTDGGVYLR